MTTIIDISRMRSGESKVYCKYMADGVLFAFHRKLKDICDMYDILGLDEYEKIEMISKEEYRLLRDDLGAFGYDQFMEAHDCDYMMADMRIEQFCKKHGADFNEFLEIAYQRQKAYA